LSGAGLPVERRRKPSLAWSDVELSPGIVFSGGRSAASVFSGGRGSSQAILTLGKQRCTLAEPEQYKFTFKGRKFGPKRAKPILHPLGDVLLVDFDMTEEE
jgi:hypothetical protein